MQIRAYILLSTQAEVLVTQLANCRITGTVTYLSHAVTGLLNHGEINNNNNYYIVYIMYIIYNYYLHCFILYSILYCYVIIIIIIRMEGQLSR